MAKTIQTITTKKWFKPALFIVGTLAVVMVPLLAYKPPTNTLLLDNQEYVLEIVASSEARKKGLSGHESLAANEGMLFAEPTPTVTCIWMKDMNFAIDIVWVDDTKIIRHLEERVSPKTYPKTFCPKVKTKYVVELPSGTIDKHQLAVGQKLPLN
ncbi:MAG: DUF192 domain-containing protein [Candidatus Saccharimonadales bacterium]